MTCKNHCVDYKQISKKQIYQTGGRYCSICDYYFKENFSRCPCCNIITRKRPRSNRRVIIQPPRIS